VYKRQSLKRFLVKSAFKLAQATGGGQLVFLSLDDSLMVKDRATRHLETVDWHHDHTEGTPKKPIYKNGTVFVLSRLHVGPFSFTVDLRVYMREKTVRRLNRKRSKDKRLKFRSKLPLAVTARIMAPCHAPFNDHLTMGNHFEEVLYDHPCRHDDRREPR